MCKAANEPGGPYRCAAHARTRLAAAQAAHNHATAELATFQHQAAALHDPDDPVIARRLTLAQVNHMRTSRSLARAQASWDATSQGLADLEAAYTRAVQAGDTPTQHQLLTRITTAQDTINRELTQRNQRWGTRPGARAHDRVASVPTTPRGSDGAPHPDQEVTEFTQATGLRAWARHYPPTPDHPDGTWHVHLTRTHPDGRTAHHTMTLPGGQDPTMRAVLDTSIAQAGTLTATTDAVHLTSPDPTAEAELRRIDTWRQRLAFPPPQVTAADMDHQPYAAWAIANGHLPDKQAAAIMRTNAAALGADPRTPFTAAQATAMSDQLATRGLAAVNAHDPTWRSYLAASGNYQVLAAADRAAPQPAAALPPARRPTRPATRQETAQALFWGGATLLLIGTLAHAAHEHGRKTIINNY